MSRFGRRPDAEEAFRRLEPVLQDLLQFVGLQAKVEFHNTTTGADAYLEVEGQQISWVRSPEGHWQYSGGRAILVQPRAYFDPPDYEYEEAWTAFSPEQAVSKAIGTLVRYRIELEMDRRSDDAMAEALASGKSARG